MERKNDNHFFSKFRQILWLIQFCQESWCEKAGDVNDSTGSEKCNLIHNFFFFFFHPYCDSIYIFFALLQLFFLLFIKSSEVPYGFYFFFTSIYFLSVRLCPLIPSIPEVIFLTQNRFRQLYVDRNLPKNERCHLS